MQSQDSKFYIHPDAAPPDDRVVVLKHGDTFLLCDRQGDIYGGHGLFHEDTRYLSALTLRFGEVRPVLLSAGDQNVETGFTVNLTNPDMELADGGLLPRGTLHLVRSKLLWHGVSHEQLELSNYGPSRVSVRLRVAFEADFADIFEVRGTRREKRGRLHEPEAREDGVVVRYDGLDRRTRTVRLAYSRRPSAVRARELEFLLTLDPGASEALFLSVSCDRSASGASEPAAYAQAHAELTASLAAARRSQCDLRSTSVRFNDWLARSLSDIGMMTSDTPEGPYPYAGVPWFSTPFGRDGIITALQLLWVRPRLARGVLRYLAATQSTAFDPVHAAEPGKILHETRKGEMSNLGEVPFGRYYGSVDATPLYVMLAGAYYRATADRALIEDIWPNLERALDWIERRGDVDQDGFLEYAGDPAGLTQQGWKDSSDSVFHADGSDAEGPIALCEVQGYAFAAFEAAASLAALLGMRDRAEHWMRKARRLQELFEARFWCEDLGTYALALDGHKRPCRVRTSNAGHCLFTGIVSPERAPRLVATLMDPRSFSGWGIRTLAVGEARYNPMSYHNGSIWPHDNAIIAAGLARYGFRHEALRVTMGLYESSLHFGTMRLPELFCGFERRAHEPPTLYPVACSPQAWASGAAFMLLEACLGLSIDAPARRVQFSHPLLPPFLHELHIHKLQVGADVVDLTVHRYPEDVGINVVGRTGPVQVVNIK